MLIISQKKQKLKTATKDEEIVKAALKLVQYDRDTMCAILDWNDFAKYLTHENKLVKW